MGRIVFVVGSNFGGLHAIDRSPGFFYRHLCSRPVSSRLAGRTASPIGSCLEVPGPCLGFELPHSCAASNPSSKRSPGTCPYPFPTFHTRCVVLGISGVLLFKQWSVERSCGGSGTGRRGTPVGLFRPVGMEIDMEDFNGESDTGCLGLHQAVRSDLP